jgi:hypothetical protein
MPNNVWRTVGPTTATGVDITISSFDFIPLSANLLYLYVSPSVVSTNAINVVQVYGSKYSLPALSDNIFNASSILNVPNGTSVTFNGFAIPIVLDSQNRFSLRISVLGATFSQLSFYIYGYGI